MNNKDLQLHKQYQYNINEWTNIDGIFGVISDNSSINISYSDIQNGTAYINAINNSNIYISYTKNSIFADNILKASNNSIVTNIINGLTVNSTSIKSYVSKRIFI